MSLPLAAWSLFILIVFANANQPGAFWHISDVHYDPLLSKEKRSCVIDVETVPSWGTEYCDSNLKLVQSAFQAMKRLNSNPDFIVWTGDSALHYWTKGLVGTKEEIVNILTILSEMLDNEFPNVPVISSLGNHDYVPDNQLPAEMNEIYTNISRVWERLGWFNGEIGEHGSFEKYGYYTFRLPSGLIATALNTNFYYLGNKVYENQPDDPGSQFAMLEGLLEEARMNSTKVLISAHVPFGVGARGDYVHMYRKYNARLIKIVRDYHDVIMASFFGHEHNSAIKLVFNAEKTTPVSVAFLAPSITPWRYIIPNEVTSPYHNPAIRLVNYDRTSLEVTDYTQYFFDLRKANDGQNVSWDRLYQFTEAYEVSDATTPSVYKVAKAIRSGEKLTEYLTSYYCTKDIPACDETCRAGLSCTIFDVTLDGITECVDAIPPRTTTPSGSQRVSALPMFVLIAFVAGHLFM